ncbi:MAG: hypothetical protein H7837_05535 [Magnetococcus sp. MYC-9]
MLPVEAYRLLDLPSPRPPRLGLDRWHHAAVGWFRRWRGPPLADRVAAVQAVAQGYGAFSEEALRYALQPWVVELRRHPGLAVVDGACAVLLEMARRALGCPCSAEVVRAVLAMDGGWLVELPSCQERTVAAVLAALLVAWRGRSCHLLTGSDVSSEQHWAAASRLGSWTGQRVGLVQTRLEAGARQQQYACDVICVTVRQLAEDFLRDRHQVGVGRVAERNRLRWLIRPATSPTDLFLRGLASAVVADADRVMLDEALVPGHWRIPQGDVALPAPEREERIAIPSLLGGYRRLAGIAARIGGDAGEYWSLYGLPVVAAGRRPVCPTPRTYLFATMEEKWQAVVDAIDRLRGTETRIVLVVRHVGSARALADLLRAQGIIGAGDGDHAGVAIVLSAEAEMACVEGVAVWMVEMLESPRREEGLWCASGVATCRYISLDEKSVQNHWPALLAQILRNHVSKGGRSLDRLSMVALDWVRHRARRADRRRRLIVHTLNTLWE